MRRLDHFEKAAFDALIGAGFDRNEAMTFIQDRADKRFTAAVAAMQGLLARSQLPKEMDGAKSVIEYRAKAAIQYADALLAALAEGETK